jgi:glycosyltransferase involved in cell wall biosynthesis
LLRSVADIIGRVDPDIVHSHLLDSNFYSSLACRLRGIPHVCTEHGDLLFIRGTTAQIKYASIALCSRLVVCVSDAVMQSAKRVVPASKLETVPNGIRFFKPGPSTFRAEFGIPAAAVVIGNVGNLYPVKGQQYLIDAFAGLLKSHPEAYLVLVGRGAEKDCILKQVQQLGMPEGKVILTGFRNDVENILNGLDLYVQPSLSEGHPLALLEAMSLGIPVIASAVGGIPELFGGGQYGTLAAPALCDELRAALLDYFRHPGPFREKALSARDHVQKTFSIRQMTGRYTGLYEQVLAGQRVGEASTHL